VLFGEDDCSLPPDYALTLRSEAELHTGDIVSAPWLNVPSTEERLATLRRLRASGVDRIGLDTHPSTFPARTLETPFLPALTLISRDVFDEVSFFTGFRGNAYREETDFFVSAARKGFRCLLTPSTASFQAAHWEGGQRTGRLRYEYWAWRNNRLFLTRHGAWLRAHGYIRSRSRSEFEFISRRIGTRARGRVRALLGAGQ
jgi:GT2 family glycosyltransferase